MEDKINQVGPARWPLKEKSLLFAALTIGFVFHPGGMKAELSM
jgi:hypothetical protein